MDTIYIITSGEYSEYSIHSVWNDKNKAEEICAQLNSEYAYVTYQVEGYPLNPISE